MTEKVEKKKKVVDPMKRVDALMDKTLRLARVQLGQPDEQVNCTHRWEYSKGRTKRVCKKCKLRQKTETVWVNYTPPNKWEHK